MSLTLYHLLLLIFSLFISSVNSNSYDEKSVTKACPPHYCGNITIKYPFWLQDDTNSDPYCGYKGFGLNCTPQNQTILSLQNEIYCVKTMDYTNYTLTLVDADVTTNQICPRPRHNLTIDNYLPLNVNLTLDVNLTFYFNCSSYPPEEVGGLIECLGLGVSRSYVYKVGSEPDGNDWYNSCEEKVVVTVIDQREINNVYDLIDWYSRAMKEGFILNWHQMEGCYECEESDGACGHDQRTQNFSCFCSNGNINSKNCKGKSALNLGLKIGIGFAAAGVGIIITCLIFYIHRRRNKKYHTPSSLVSRDISSYPSSVMDLEKGGTIMGVQMFTYIELEEATNNFDTEKELGDGGFGTVYLGKLKDGRTVAVKRLYEHNFKRVEQFMNEVVILTRLRHQNLVTLYGCTSRHCRELLLVYEYIPNGTVADHLHGERRKPGSLPWNTRMGIAIETASALAYLHASDVVHRDVKTNNILLENSFSVKVADFGLSRLFPINVTHVSTAPQGTPGYVDPEYHQCYQLTDKSDVYSFGVVLVELISSMPAVDITRHRHEINLSNMAINKIQSGALHELVDQNLGFESDYKVKKMITNVAELAFQCLQNEKDMRPSMEEVLNTLKKIQNEDNDKKKEDEEDKPTEVVVLLKNDTLTLSPDSVTASWMSTSTKSNASH